MESRKKKAPEDVTIRAAKNGGFIARHSYNNMGSGESYQPPDEYAFGNHKAMMAHVHAHTSKMGGASDLDADDATPAGVSGKAKAAPPTQRTKGAGVD
jgi:hypothetical protein